MSQPGLPKKQLVQSTVGMRATEVATAILTVTRKKKNVQPRTQLAMNQADIIRVKVTLIFLFFYSILL
jgi:hypothetical protein